MRLPGTGLYHGTWWDLHKKDKLEQVVAGRFTRLLPKDGDPVDWDGLDRLAGEMTPPHDRAPTPETTRLDPEEDREITAAYTYLGQFVDHDLTFDPTSQLREALDDKQLEALADFRTPRFDLDNLYGRGPIDQPYMFDEDGIRMLLGEPMSGNPFDQDARQVPRGPSGRALLGDPRNDENRIVAQLHAIFLRFHNRVADYLAKPEQLGQDVTFEAVRQQVRWHYQWMLVTDYLPTVVNNKTYLRVFADRHNPSPRLPGGRDSLRLMPVEFSVAAFRFGHSMIRPQYRLNTTVERRPIFLRDDGTRADDAADLGGFRPIPSDWAIDWRFFIDLGQDAWREATSQLYDPIPRRPQMAFKIDTSLASPLRDLPARIASDPSMLARRNLERGATFKLPSGQAVAKALGEKAIRDKDLVIGAATEKSTKTPLRDIAGSFAGRAPLWAYILSEAQVSSWDGAAGSSVAPDNIPIKLGPVGGRLVAGVFAALLRGDPTSYLTEGAPFTPIKDFTRGGKFGLAQLINVALWRAP